MLEIKNLSKVYKPKKGVPVTALKNINLKLPDKGMVFLLGKSGSGKSTLLNLLGGLDRYDGGEILINGVSSKDFKQSHFDSYRNTYVGFIFQEYNILDEFNVGQNIAIAIELQGKKATDEAINNILTQVDLEGYGNRKPNELSGGQKQRVAIARALVKNPEIIMADEPTGALDSNTGKQVFDTLKKLSHEKLIIVVSHDREFAENYADRIIELADGNIINDITLDSEYNDDSGTENISFDADTVTVKSGYHLTESDLKRINEYIDCLKNSDLKLSFKENKNNRFKSTDTQSIKSDNSREFKLIKSKLPLRNAFKMGASGLKHKKFRLVITIVLSCIAFGLFGLSDTFGSYNHIKVCTNSIYDTGVDYASVVKSEKYGDDWYDYKHYLSDQDISDIENNTGVIMKGVFYPKGSDLSFENNINPDIQTSESDYEIYYSDFSGFAEINEQSIADLDYTLVAGRYPDGTKDEIAVSKYIFEVFAKTQYTDGVPVKDAKGNMILNYQDIKEYNDLLEKTITVNNVKYKQLATTTVVSENLFNRFSQDDGGKYVFAVGAMPTEKTNIKTLVSYCYTEDTGIRYPLQNSATFELDMINSELKEFAKVFFYIGLGFAVFAAIMLANFIGTSISYKKQEIGILRAIGSRSNDVFRIFFSESFIIAIINFTLSTIGVFTVTQIINMLIRKNLGILITLLTFGPRQIILLLFVSVFVAFISSFLPVNRIASKKPIDAIRDR